MCSRNVLPGGRPHPGNRGASRRREAALRRAAEKQTASYSAGLRISARRCVEAASASRLDRSIVGSQLVLFHGISHPLWVLHCQGGRAKSSRRNSQRLTKPGKQEPGRSSKDERTNQKSGEQVEGNGSVGRFKEGGKHRVRKHCSP